jgi:hypothetical protein
MMNPEETAVALFDHAKELERERDAVKEELVRLRMGMQDRIAQWNRHHEMRIHYFQNMCARDLEQLLKRTENHG